MLGSNWPPTAEPDTIASDCPFCSAVQRRPANQRVVSILLATGVEYEIVTTAGPITETEIHSFAKALEADGWFAELAASES